MAGASRFRVVKLLASERAERGRAGQAHRFLVLLGHARAVARPPQRHRHQETDVRGVGLARQGGPQVWNSLQYRVPHGERSLLLFHCLSGFRSPHIVRIQDTSLLFQLDAKTSREVAQPH